MIKLTTLLHSVDMRLYQKYTQVTILKWYSLRCVLFFLLSLDLQFAARNIGFTFSVVMSTVAFLVLPILVAKRSSSVKSLRKHNFRRLDQKRLIEMDNEGINIKVDSGSHSYTVWSDYESASRGEGYVNLFLSKSSVIQIPDTAWPSTVERDQFLALLRSKNLLKG